MEKFIKTVCKLLDIDVPNISYDNSRFTSTTMMAATDFETLFLRPNYITGNDLYFTIAHELRHIWQHKTNHNLYFSNPVKSNGRNILEYNLQLAEIDANAFASLIMDYFFDVVVTFDALPDVVVDKIFEREDFIEPNYFYNT